MLYVIFYAYSILQQMRRAVSDHRSFIPDCTSLPLKQLRTQFTAFSSIIHVLKLKISVNIHPEHP
ncbi:hypothetical protein NE634_19955, partial [Lacrimispora saccharolytica]|nr:hypothetical protein [Lacrimispora saccharolytica]